MIRALMLLCLSIDAWSENTLKDAVSPYLRQHAENPIHWVEWSANTLAKAKKENKLIFLSIGYSSCHWCHVMEKETFADPEVAAKLNPSFINIKVDKETRPDIDHIYMTALKLMKGEGGWPVTAFLTPDARVVFIDSYLPKDKFLSLSSKLANIWQAQPAILASNAARLMQQVESHLAPRHNAITLNNEVVSKAAKILAEKMDSKYGGLTGLPKFPNEMAQLLLLDWSVLNNKTAVLKQVTSSLDAMALSALFDPVEGGIHRYAVDTAYKVPHYEKMLYNQGLILSLYARAYSYQPKPRFKVVIEGTVFFLLNSMSNGGLFFSAIDADSPNGSEGAYYQYTVEQKQSILGEHSVLSAGPLTAKELAVVDLSEAKQASIIKAFFDLRQPELKPFVDQKSITAWNAMAIRGLIDAGVALSRSEWVELAETRLQKLLTTNVNQGELKRFSFNGVLANEAAALEDYAWVVSALIGLYDATTERKWLDEAEHYFSQMEDTFYDESALGFKLFHLDGLSSNVLDMEDNNYPSPSAMAVLTAKQLVDRTGKLRFATYARLPINPNELIKSPEFYATLLQSTLGYGLPQQYYFASGKGSLTKVNQKLSFSLAEGWHINADKVNDLALIPTQVVIESREPIEYPTPSLMDAPFSQEALPVFEGQFTIDLPRASGSQKAKVILQACSQDKCLPPETLHVH